MHCLCQVDIYKNRNKIVINFIKPKTSLLGYSLASAPNHWWKTEIFHQKIFRIYSDCPNIDLFALELALTSAESVITKLLEEYRVELNITQWD